MEKKETLGGRKMKMISNFESRRVAFSRRRLALFKKANELCALCGSDAAIVAFSPGGNAFSFGHPSVESVISRFLTQDLEAKDQDPGELPASSPREARVRELNQQLGELRSRVEAEMDKGETLRRRSSKVNERRVMCDEAINELGLHELERVKESMMELKMEARARDNAKPVESLLLANKPVHGADVAAAGKIGTNTSTIPRDWLKL